MTETSTKTTAQTSPRAAYQAAITQGLVRPSPTAN
ncbi:hypothetical protein GGR19_001707 [Croceicoccus naphthovorans]|nr:hypothetical protein [Croceicoccus naphthovorans]